MYNSNLGQPKEEKERKQMTEQERSLLNKLLPRIFKLKLIHIPQSNEHEVIVEPYRSVLGFKTNCYKPNQKIIGPHMAQEEFDRVVFQANKIIEQEVLESKKREHEDSFAEATLFLRIAVFLTTVGTLFMSVIVYGKFGPELESVMQYVGIGLICAAALAAIIVVVFIHRAKFVPSNFQQKVWSKLSQLMSKETRALAESGRSYMTWGVGQQFFWLSLSISYLHMPKEQQPKSATQIDH